MTKPWHAARWASYRPLPKQRLLHPTTVGERMDSAGHLAFGSHRRSTFLAPGEVSCCSGCGYHVWSCFALEDTIHTELPGRRAAKAVRAKECSFGTVSNYAVVIRNMIYEEAQPSFSEAAQTVRWSLFEVDIVLRRELLNGGVVVTVDTSDGSCAHCIAEEIRKAMEASL